MTSDPLAWWWGMKLSDELDLRSGTIYPLLARLEKAAWLESAWEKVDPSEEGRPRRRLYRLTGLGELTATRALAEIGPARPADPAPPRPSAGPLPEAQWT
jgi:DNA-binding PadR family transcriptional regulator